MIPEIKIQVSLWKEGGKKWEDGEFIVEVFKSRTTGALEIADQEENAVRLADQAVRELFAKFREKLKQQEEPKT